MAVNAGIDMSMVPYEVEFCDLLRELVDEGRVSMTRIDDAVRRILRLKIRLGLLDKQTWDKDVKQLAQEFPDFASEGFAAEAERMADTVRPEEAERNAGKACGFRSKRQS